MMIFRLALVSLAAVAAALPAQDDKAPRKATYRVTGMFRPDREADFKEAMKDVADVKLVSVDYKNAEATFEFAPAKAFPGANKPEQFVEQLDSKVRHASNHTFGVRAMRATPREKLKLVEVRVAGCHCKACDLAAYEIVARMPGVEQATASFAAGRVTALIDPAKTDRAKLIEALKAREVDVKER
jgi:cation transport ATPase